MVGIRTRSAVLDAEQPAPGLAVEHEVVAAERECHAHLLHLVDEPVDLPQDRFVRLVAQVGAELVVEVDLDAGVDQILLHRQQVLVGGARTAVQQEQPQPRVVAGLAGPDLEAAGGGLDRDHPDAVAHASLPSSTVGLPRRNVATTRPGSSRPAYGVLRERDASSEASTTCRADGS